MTHKRNRHLIFWLSVALLASAAGTLWAQPDAGELFGESIDVRVVNLEVVVEQRGERVRGLTARDFVLKVDGDEVPVELFSEISGGAGVSSSHGGGDYRTVPSVRPGSRVGTRYLVFIDDVFTIGPYRNRVLRSLSDDLGRLGPEDHMAVVAYNGRSIDMLTNWTQSERDLERAFRRAQDRPTHGLRNRSLQRVDDDFRLRSGFGRLGPYGGYSGFYGARGSRSFSEAQEVITAASSTLRAFAQPEGRKVLIMLSGSWPVVTAGGQTSSYVRYDRSSSLRFFAPLVDTANLLGYTVYPVDVAGVETNFADASFGSIRQASFAQAVNRDREWLQEGNLVELADQTGGQALLDGASGVVLKRIQEDTRSYYSIGFTPNWRANDRRHRIDVDVPGLKRVRVRFRDSFTDLSARTQASLRLESAQLFDLPVPSAGRLAVGVGEARNAGWRKVILPLEIKIPLGWVTHFPTADGYAGRVELRVAVTDDRGDRADIPVVPLVLETEAKPAEGDEEIYVMQLKMRQRPHRVLVSLLDPATGEELTERLEVDPSV